MEHNDERAAGYMHVRSGTVARQVECGAGVIIDVDTDGRVLGVENYSGHVDVAALFRVIEAAVFARSPK